jgi:hypothetical protein
LEEIRAFYIEIDGVLGGADAPGVIRAIQEELGLFPRFRSFLEIFPSFFILFRRRNPPSAIYFSPSLM